MTESGQEPSLEDLLQHIRRVATSVERAREEIIEEIQGTQLANLAGDVNGLGMLLSEYTAYNRETEYHQWLSEGERLREIIDDGAIVVGHLEEELNRLDLAQSDLLDYAGEVFSVFASAIPLRGTAMLERTRHYQTHDANHIPEMHLRIRTQVNRLLPALRRESDRRFSGVKVRRDEPAGQGKYYWQCYYEFEGNSIDVGHPVLEHKLPDAKSRARQVLKEHKQIAFLGYHCLPVCGAAGS
jgi:hypothetical protein